MKKALLTTLVFLNFLTIAGQPIIKCSQVNIGKNLTTGKDIKATQYAFQDRIYDVNIDTTLQKFTIQLRKITSNEKYYKNTGYLVSLDVSSKKIQWWEKINYVQNNIEQYENVLFWTISGGTTTRKDLNTGDKMWTTKVVIFATIPNLNISLGYKFNSFSGQLSKDVSCIDLITGKVLWEREIDNRYNWNGIEAIDDTTIIIKSSGLHYVNLKTGKGWDYIANTGVNNYAKTVGVNAAGVALGLLTGTFVLNTGPDLVSNLVSNLANDSLHLYFASKDYLTCLSYNGNIKWKVALPKETSQSNIFYDSTKVYLINEGLAQYNGRECNYGKPYIAAFDKATGQQHYLSIFDFKKNPLLNFVIGDSIDLLFSGRLVRFSLKTGKYNDAKYNYQQVGNFKYLVDMFDTFVTTNSTFQNLHSLDSGALYIASDIGKVVKLKSNLQFDKTIEFDKLYTSKAKFNKYQFLYNNEKVIVINDLNHKIAEFSMGREIFILQNKLYCINKNTITELVLDKEFN